MTHQEIIEANRLLAEFLGAAENPHGEYEMYGVIPTIDDSESDKHFYNPMEMEFSSSWAWIMQVVEKIESISVGNELQHEVLMNGCNCRIIDRAGTVITEYESERTKIDAVYYTCVDFVKWYNENKAI